MLVIRDRKKTVMLVFFICLIGFGWITHLDRYWHKDKTTTPIRIEEETLAKHAKNAEGN